MFTGIVEELGEVAGLEPDRDSARLTVRGPLVVSDAVHGASIAVNGVCLTVTDVEGDVFAADVMRETLDRSSLGDLVPGSPVNLERAVRLADRMGGHLVQGHVDGVGLIVSRERGPRWDLVTVGLPAPLSRYVVEKGSITVDGVSLTVVEARAEEFTISLIPTTLDLTTLGRKGPGDRVNIEVDVIAKYVERAVGHYAAGHDAGGHDNGGRTAVPVGPYEGPGAPAVTAAGGPSASAPGGPVPTIPGGPAATTLGGGAPDPRW